MHPARITRPRRLTRVPRRARSVSYGGSVAKHLHDETAEFALPTLGRHAAADTGELDMTQRFDPGFSRPRPGTPAVPSRDDQTR